MDIAHGLSSHLISPHVSLRGVPKCVLSCTRISDKVPGKLGGSSTGDTRILQNAPDEMLPEAVYAQAARMLSRTLHQSRLKCRSKCHARTLQSLIQNIHPQNSPCHPYVFPVIPQHSIERNSTMPLPAFFVGRWFPAEQPEIRMQCLAFVSLLL